MKIALMSKVFFLLQAAKERGRAGRGEGIHYYSYKLSFSLCGLKVSTFSNDCKFLIALSVILIYSLTVLLDFWDLNSVLPSLQYGR